MDVENLNHYLPVKIGFDESNHGNFPEIMVGVFSQLEEDTVERSLKKIRNDGKHRKLSVKLKSRGYSFLLLEEKGIWRIGRKDLIGVVLSSLIYDVRDIFPEYRFYVDGLDMTPSKTDYSRDVISDLCKIKKSQVILQAGPRYDETFHLVNIADELAHYLFRHSYLENLSKNPNRKELLK